MCKLRVLLCMAERYGKCLSEIRIDVYQLKYAVFCKDVLRRRLDRIRNDVTLTEMGIEREVVDDVKNRQLVCLVWTRGAEWQMNDYKKKNGLQRVTPERHKRGCPRRI